MHCVLCLTVSVARGRVTVASLQDVSSSGDRGGKTSTHMMSVREKVSDST